MDFRFADAMSRLPDYLGNHVLVSFTALVIGLAASLPLALLSLRRPILRNLLLTATSIVQTIPGLALLALFYPLLLGVAAICESTFGFSFSALGFLPAVLALALYSMLPVVRNTITGLMSIEPAIRKSAAGVGMTPQQSLRMVELPLALPVIMAGVRTASVWVIGTATLSTPIGQTSLGNYIFIGLQTQNWIFVLFGCVSAAVLALAVDQMLALMESGYSGRRRWRVATGAAGFAAILLVSLLPLVGQERSAYTIGSKTFAEQYILANLLERRLEAAGLSARRTNGLGSAVVFEALVSGEVDAYVDYTGTIWTNQMKRTDVKPRADVLAGVEAWLEKTYNVKVLGALGFENAYSLAVSAKRAQQDGLKTIADLASVAPDMTIAGDYEFFGRPEWRSIRDTYGLRFRNQRLMQAEFMYQAAGAGEVDVISAYTSDGRIAKFDLKVLEDPRQAIPPYDAILLVSAKRSADKAFMAALAPLVGAIDVSVMREANARASDGASPAQAAAWLDGKIRR